VRKSVANFIKCSDDTFHPNGIRFFIFIFRLFYHFYEEKSKENTGLWKIQFLSIKMFFIKEIGAESLLKLSFFFFFCLFDIVCLELYLVTITIFGGAKVTELTEWSLTSRYERDEFYCIR